MTPKEAIARILTLGFKKPDTRLSHCSTTIYDVEGDPQCISDEWELTAWIDGKSFVACETASKLEQLVERMELRYGGKQDS